VAKKLYGIGQPLLEVIQEEYRTVQQVQCKSKNWNTVLTLAEVEKHCHIQVFPQHKPKKVYI
jgi:hypothetical protein